LNPSMSVVLPRVIGHRGAKAIAPENTLASIRAAKRVGAAFVEVDVMLSKDKVYSAHRGNSSTNRDATT
jgi:glycerophosphoryl diester phosphodiesterase